MNTPSPSRWGDLFDTAISIIDQANREHTIVDRWTLGGGTALMLHIDHRESHDIDLFTDDPQCLPFLNPETQGYDLQLRPSSYGGDGVRSLKLAFDGVGEIDVICCGWMLDEPSEINEIRGVTVELETPAEIVAKKVYYRGGSFQPRDMFDIAAVADKFGRGYLADSLAGCKDQARAALAVIDRGDPEFIAAIVNSLSVQPEFEDIQADAQRLAAEALRAALGD